ncbi:bifunctional diguanylate cyclase/phosphodiesterase [Solilutibacter pythonis]|nr:EAL domain-containing protein [Lysobacter pythonis]
MVAWLWSLLAFVLGVVISFWFAGLEDERAIKEHARVFQAGAESVYSALEYRLQSCELVLRSMQLFYLSSDEVREDEFDVLATNLMTGRGLPDLQAVTYSRRVDSASGIDFIIESVVPRAGNETLYGRRLGSRPGDRQAALASADGDDVRLSAPLHLRQVGTEGAGIGVVMRLPVYSPGGLPRNTAERRQRLRGMLAASFRVSKLIEGAGAIMRKHPLRVEVKDLGSGEILHEGMATKQTPGFIRNLDYGGRSWQVAIEDSAPVHAVSRWMLVFWPGVFSSLLFAALLHLLVLRRSRAMELGRAMSERYRASETRFRRLNELLPTLVLLIDEEHGRIVYANLAARESLGIGERNVLLAGLLVDSEETTRISDVLKAGTGSRDFEMQSTRGQCFWVHATFTSMQVEERRNWLMVASDVSEQRRLTERLSWQASHDALTGLFNRDEFERRLRQVLETQGDGYHVLLFIDLDQFKVINDTAGHVAGDQLLVQLARQMSKSIGANDLLARIGGDEFGVLMCDVADMDAALARAECLRCGIAGHKFVWEEQRGYAVSASIGGVLIESRDVSIKELFMQVDTACYMAKEKGRNRVHFYFANDDASTRRRSEMEWANRLHEAIEWNRLLLSYQELRPLQPDLDTAPCIELLLRLNDENGREVLPGAFLPAAERFGLMPRIDRWVIATALANLDRLHPAGEGLARCAINLSGDSLEDPSLGDFVLEHLALHCVDPRRISFEITETVAVRNLTAANNLIERLQAMGCGIALDDFGSGMSSFGYLKNLRVDTVKIDGSFVFNLRSDPMSLAIVRAITDICHQRELKVVAEWVPDADTCVPLASIGVDYAQGNALHSPERVVFQR